MNRIIIFLTCFLLGTTLFAQIENCQPNSTITLTKGQFGKEHILHQIKTNLKLYSDANIQATTELIKACNAQTEKEIIKIQQQIWAIRQQKRDIHTIEAQQDKKLQKKELRKYLRKMKVIPFDENNIPFSFDSAFVYLDKQLSEKSDLWNNANENFLFEKNILIPHFQGDTTLMWAENVALVYCALKRDCASLTKRVEFTELKDLSYLQIHGYAEMELQREITQIWVYFYAGGMQTLLKVMAKCAVIPNENLNYEELENEVIQDSFQNYREHKLGNLDMIAVKGGSFLMGNEMGNKNEKPVFQTELSDFYLSQTEITVAQYRLFCAAKNRELPSPPSYGWKDNHPITNIMWDDALAFCEWLSQISGKTYTLPTEAQWEFAAKGGLFSENYKYSGGNDIAEVAWYNDNAEGKTHLVGSKKPNELGIYDMTGNVWELCLDDYNPDFYASLQNPNKEILNFNDAKYKISRGGSWGVNVENGCFSCRYAVALTARSHDLGFRVCCTPLNKK